MIKWVIAAACLAALLAVYLATQVSAEMCMNKFDGKQVCGKQAVAWCDNSDTTREATTLLFGHTPSIDKSQRECDNIRDKD